MAAKKGGLGKGLDSLLVNKVNADHSSDSTIVKEKSTTTKKKSTKKETPDTMVKLSLVEPNREQPRILMKMVCWSWQNPSNNTASCSLCLCRKKADIMRLLLANVAGEPQNWRG